MILWCDGGHDPAENMRRDAALLEAAAGGAEAVLRLFTFVPPGITLGRAQDPRRELDLDRCLAAGIPWAVRPTGGRGIYHDEEWTYSLAAALADPSWRGGLEAAYSQASRLLVASLVRLGVPATLAPGAARGDLAPRSALGAAAPCFASTARHEIVVEGRKLVGSAQRRTARALLQQGSVLLGSAHLRLADYLAIPDPERARGRAGLEQASVHAGRWLGQRPPLERWAEALGMELPPDSRRLDGDSGLGLLAAAAPRSAPEG
jgi:lipoyl(octanoyl) transferase